jgi:RNA polymerase sigma-70 factor, ECF subfamily
MHSESVRQAAFEAALAQGAYRAAWRYCWYLCCTREDAEDLLQDALAQAYLHHTQLKDAASFTGWLLSIVRRTHLLRLRQAQPGHGELEDAHHVREGSDAISMISAGLAALPPRLATALLRLPTPQREVLELYYLHELELAAVARVLGVAQGAAKLRLFRARAALRRQLGVGLDLAGAAAPGEYDGLA